MTRNRPISQSWRWSLSFIRLLSPFTYPPAFCTGRPSYLPVNSKTFRYTLLAPKGTNLVVPVTTIFFLVSCGCFLSTFLSSCYDAIRPSCCNLFINPNNLIYAIRTFLLLALTAKSLMINSSSSRSWIISALVSRFMLFSPPLHCFLLSKLFQRCL